MRSILLFLALIIAPSSFALSEEEIDIAADSLEVRQKDGTAHFSGDVVVQHLKMTLKAPDLEVFYAKGSDGEKGVKKVIAQPSVTLIDKGQDMKLTGKKAVYEVSNRTVTVTGNVIMTRGGSILKGDKLVYDLANGQANMINNSGRVKARFKLQ